MNRSDLKALLLLLTTCSLVSCRRLLSVDELQNTTKQSSGEVEPTKETSHTLQITEFSQEGSHANGTNAVPVSTTEGNGTPAGDLSPTEGTEMNSSREQEAGLQTSPPDLLPERSGTSVSTPGSPASTHPASVGPEERTGKPTHNSTAAVPLTDKAKRPISRTTVQPNVRTSPIQKSTPSKTSATQRPTTKACPCSTAEPRKESFVGRCLIGIAVLAAIATIFIVTTIVLATKLAGARNRACLHDTEMICISAFLNDSDHPLPLAKRPKSNGALIPNTEDDCDDLTLNSFLPDAEGAA